MFEKLVLLLLQFKLPLIGLLFISTTGFLITGTVDGKDVNLKVTPTESAACIEAVMWQTATLLDLDQIARDRVHELAGLRQRARENADQQRKQLTDAALREKYEFYAAQIQTELLAASAKVSEETKKIVPAGLDPCKDGDPNTPNPSLTSQDVALLQQKYGEIVTEFGRKLKIILDQAEQAFDKLVADAPLKPQRPNRWSDSSGD